MLLSTRAALRRLRRMRARVVGISLVIGLAMAMVVSGAYGGEVLDTSVEDYFAKGRMPDLFARLEGASPATEIASALGAVPGIRAYVLEQVAMGTSRTSEGAEVTANVVGVTDPARSDISVLQLKQGRLFSSSGEAIAVSGMETKGFGVGDRCEIVIGASSLDLEIVGLVQGPEYVFTSALPGYIVPGLGSSVTLLVPMGAIPGFAPGDANQVNILLEREDASANVLTALQPFGLIAIQEREDHPSKAFIDLGADKIKTMMPMVGYVFLLIGLVSIFMTMARVVLSDARQVGVLMALGYSRGEIARGYLAMGGVLAAAGIAVGVPLAVLLTMGFVQAMTGIFFQLDVSFPFSPLPFLAGAALVALTVVAAILLPVAMVTRRTVREALEYRPDDRVRPSKLSLGRRSMISRMGLRNAMRRPLRTLATVLAIAMTIGLAGSWLIMTDSAFGYIDEQIAADRWDLRADLSGAVATSSLDVELLGLDSQDARYLVPAAQVRAMMSLHDDSRTAAIIACDDWAQVRSMSLLKGELDFGGLVVTQDLADDLGLAIGEEVDISLGSASASVEVAGVVSDIMSGTAYTSREALSPLFPSDSSNVVFISLAQPPSAGEKASAMRAMPSVSSVLAHSELGESVDETVSMAIGMLYAFFMMSMLITILVTGVAIMVSALERDVEYATLSTLGATRGQVAKGILVEMAALGGLSALAAVPISYLISMVMANAMSQVVFYFPIGVSVEATAAMVIVGLALVLVSAYIPIRYARRLRTEQTLRERSAG